VFNLEFMVYDQIRVDLRGPIHRFRNSSSTQRWYCANWTGSFCHELRQREIFSNLPKENWLKNAYFSQYLILSVTAIYVKVFRLPSSYYIKYYPIFDMEMKPKNAYKHLTVHYITNIVNIL